jgi:hypothetical protein
LRDDGADRSARLDGLDLDVPALDGPDAARLVVRRRDAFDDALAERGLAVDAEREAVVRDEEVRPFEDRAALHTLGYGDPELEIRDRERPDRDRRQVLDVDAASLAAAVEHDSLGAATDDGEVLLDDDAGILAGLQRDGAPRGRGIDGGLQS